LEVASLGDPSGSTILFHHGTPGSAKLARLFEETLWSRGHFLVTTSRPGYGRSQRHEGRSVASAVADSAAALAHFDRDRYVAIGWSGGGPHALAHGALDETHCIAAISLAGVAPASGEFDWTEGMGPENVEEFELAMAGGEEAHEANIQSMVAEMVTASPDNVVALLGGLLSEPDLLALGSENARTLLADAIAHGAAGGHFGMLDDDGAILGEWGCELSDVGVPVEIWFGDDDLMVPPTHGRFLTGVIPNARSVNHPSEGHFSLITEFQVELFERVEGYFAD
jgi:pimeloyl-ACP methyl ester carboxylesterase